MKRITKQMHWAMLIMTLWLMGCQQKTGFREDFNKINNRTWISSDFWSVPLEDWKVNNGRLECVGARNNMKVNVITSMLTGTGDLNVSFNTGLLKSGSKNGTVGVAIGVQDETDNDVRSLCYFGNGIEVGIDTQGLLFIDEVSTELPKKFSMDNVSFDLSVKQLNGLYKLTVKVDDHNGNTASVMKDDIDELKGLVQLVNTAENNRKAGHGPQFWFDDFEMTGSMVEMKPEQSFGPILWSMHTLSRGKLKISAQMPPIGVDDNQQVELEIQKDGKWTTIASEKIEGMSRTALFSIPDWDDSMDTPYRLVYNEKRTDGSTIPDYYEGVIKRDPKGKEVVVAGMTCQFHYGFPYRPLSENIGKKNPDLLFFSGDQIYEPNGGYGIIRYPEDMATLNYLGKWYMFGWAFGDLMRSTPTVCIPDDHDVFQGNLWGNSGNTIESKEWNKTHGTSGGYVEPKEMVNAVHRTQSGHLPDAYDPTPIDQGINVYYTDMVYGDVSFAIISDRMFKSGPQEVCFWGGREDHLKENIKNPKMLDKPGLEMLGKRQEKFISEWMTDWQGAKMKVLLSQTLFANAATHHGGNKMFLAGDLDSGGWPQTPRDRAVDMLRKCFAYQICGDQHLPSMVQYGIDNFRDGSWVFCTPAIAVGYQRRFHPDRLGWPVKDRPAHGNANTGAYLDGFGNKNYIYAVGNPVDNTHDLNRYKRAQNCSSGFGISRFNTNDRTITSEAYRFLADLSKEDKNNQFPGWPMTVSQLDNYGKASKYYLPNLKIEGATDAVVEIRHNKSQELISVLRIKGDKYRAKVFEKGDYDIVVIDPESGKEKTLTKVASQMGTNGENIVIKL
ncbi:twin-arginine translocation pathway signal [Puteibacter caeruleilacunae]|nr:twin-arginine translocation pathway signal [Puteibacter caeruleilacunae]